MVVAQRDLDPGTALDGQLIDLVQDLTLLAMVGIVDPPRAEAKDAIAECRSAGIRVRMITGDHATTAAAIATELGIEGKAVTGAEFAAMSDEQLRRDLDNIGVVARVAPEDKVRLVRLLKEMGNVVAMTGDGVNDAPALKTADIGVAMGITGTEVSKEAAVMILTDDNFATIVGAVSYGRALVRQPPQVPALPDVDTGRLHRHLHRRRDLRHRQRLTAQPVADPVAEHGRRHPVGDRARVRPARPRPDVASSATGRAAGPLAEPVDQAVCPGRRDDDRGARRLPDRRFAGHRRHRCDHVAHGAVPVPRGRRAAVPRPGQHDLRPRGHSRPAAAAPLRHRPAGDHRCHGSRVPEPHPRHDRARVRPVVHLRRDRPLDRGRRGADQARVCAAGTHPPSPRMPPAHSFPYNPPPPEQRRSHAIQPSSSQLPQGAGLRARRAALPAPPLRGSQGREVRRLRDAATPGQERRADLREDVDADPHRIPGRGHGPGGQRDLPGAERLADRAQGVDEGHRPRARADLRRHRVPRASPRRRSRSSASTPASRSGTASPTSSTPPRSSRTCSR